MNADFRKEACIDLKPLDEILPFTSNVGPDGLMPTLQEIQKAYGYLPQEVLLELSNRTGIAASRIYGVATFYEQFHLKPHGKNTIRCCRGTACHVNNGVSIINAIAEALNIEPGETTDDMRFTFETVACLGTCFLAPVMMVNNDYHGHLTPSKIKNVLEQYC